MGNVDKLKAGIDVGEFYARYLDGYNPNEDLHLCPFPHSDGQGGTYNESHPSLSIDPKYGKFNCFSCGTKGGDCIEFYRNLPGNEDKAFPDILQELAEEFSIEIDDKVVVPADVVSGFHGRLLKEEKVLTFLREERGITLKTVKEFVLGWDGQRITIPILDASGDVVNLRKYKPHVKRQKCISYSDKSGDKKANRSYGRGRLFPISNLAEDTLIICEGEMDALLLHDQGYAALTGTAGATTWKVSWNKLFHNKVVFICYDKDQPGRQGSQKVAENIAPYAREVRIVELPLEEKGADVTDYFMQESKGTEDFDLLLEQAELYQPATRKRIPKAAEPPIDLSLSEASNAEHHGRTVRIRARVAGKNLAPYQVPIAVEYTCDMSFGDKCSDCPVGKKGGTAQLHFAKEDEDLLKFININDSILRAILKSRQGIPQRCTKVEIENLEMVNIEEIRLIPDVDFTESQASYVVRQAFMVGERIELNRVFVFTGKTLPDPRTQFVTHLFNNAEPEQSSLERFTLTEDMRKSFKVLTVKGKTVDALHAQADKLCEELEVVTKIIGRRDVILAVLLTYFSPIAFTFQNIEQRGWMDTLIIGDTRTGKTQVVNAILNHIRVGDMTAGENCTLAGLLAGLQQVNKQWILMWGAFPLNDLGLYIVDEASGLRPEDMARLSSVRSSGIAQVTKVHTERTNSRTRKIWMANPRADHGLYGYNHGVFAVKELFGQLEDVARTDLVVAVASGEVEQVRIHNEIGSLNTESKLQFTSSLLHDAVLWAWTLRAPDVTFTPTATEAVLSFAENQGKRYAPSIPLVEPAEQRIKLARVSAAAACLFMGTSKYDKVRVDAHHVEFAYQFLEQLYAKPSLGYADYSRRELRKLVLEDEDQLRRIVTPELRELFRDTDYINQHNMKDVLGIDSMTEIARVMQQLLKCNALVRKGTQYYRKTNVFIRWLNDPSNWDAKAQAKAKGKSPRKTKSKSKRKF